MRYLFVANQEPLQGYTEFCNNTYLALLCETKRNEHSSLPNEYIRSEQLYFIGSTVKLDISDFNILVIWDRNNLDKIIDYLGFTPRIVILSELLELLTSNYINSFEYNLCIHCVLQRKNYPSSFTAMENFIQIITHEIELPEAMFLSEIERVLPNNYLQNRVQSGIVCTFNQAIVSWLKDLIENSILIDKFFTSTIYYFLQDLKSLYFMSKLRITTFLWENCSKRVVIQRDQEVIHLIECEAIQNQEELSPRSSAGGIQHNSCFSQDNNSNPGFNQDSGSNPSFSQDNNSNPGFSPVIPKMVLIYKSIITLFDGYTLCEKCKEKLTGIYNSVTEFNYNERIVKNFCNRYEYGFSVKLNGSFEIVTNVSEWFLDITVNSSKVTNLFHKNMFEGGGCRNKGKKRKMFQNGFHKQHVNCNDLIYILNYIHVHDEAREKEKMQYSFISEKFIQKNFKKINN